MSQLIDDIVDECQRHKVIIDIQYYAAKPIENINFFRRVADSFRVLVGKSIAVHYKTDEKKNNIVLTF